MTLNLTFQHFAAFCVMAWLASQFVTGAKLFRLIGWIAIWQLLSPVRPAWQDVPMMLVGWGVTEVLYLLALRLTISPESTRR